MMKKLMILVLMMVLMGLSVSAADYLIQDDFNREDGFITSPYSVAQDYNFGSSVPIDAAKIVDGELILTAYLDRDSGTFQQVTATAMGLEGYNYTSLPEGYYQFRVYMEADEWLVNPNTDTRKDLRITMNHNFNLTGYDMEDEYYSESYTRIGTHNTTHIAFNSYNDWYNDTSGEYDTVDFSVGYVDMTAYLDSWVYIRYEWDENESNITFTMWSDDFDGLDLIFTDSIDGIASGDGPYNNTFFISTEHKFSLTGGLSTNAADIEDTYEYRLDDLAVFGDFDESFILIQEEVTPEAPAATGFGIATGLAEIGYGIGEFSNGAAAGLPKLLFILAVLGLIVGIVALFAAIIRNEITKVGK